MLATTVGPYRRYGLPVVEACAEAGTHYADLTGEVALHARVDRPLRRHRRRRGARIVHTCGFDSIPSDLGVLLLHERARRDGAGELDETTLVVRSFRGGVSGGTFASMRGQLDEAARDPALARVMDDPYALSPDRTAEPDLGDENDPAGVERDADARRLGRAVRDGPVNTRVVRRSNALQDWAYGRADALPRGDGLRRRDRRPGARGGVGGGLRRRWAPGCRSAPTRSLLDRVLPAPGEGPSEQAREKRLFRIETHTRTSRRRHLRLRASRPRATPATRRRR